MNKTTQLIKISCYVFLFSLYTQGVSKIHGYMFIFPHFNIYLNIKLPYTINSDNLKIIFFSYIFFDNIFKKRSVQKFSKNFLKNYSYILILCIKNSTFFVTLL